MVVQLLWVLSGLMDTGYAIWPAMSGSGQVVVIIPIVRIVTAFSAAAAGVTSTPTVCSRTGSNATRALRATTPDFECVVECFLGYLTQ